MTNLIVLLAPMATGVALLLYWRRRRISALRYAGGAVLASTAVLAAVWSVTVVAPGTVKVQVLFGRVLDTTLSEGFHVINPLVNLVAYGVRRQRVEVTAAQGSESGSPAVDADGVRLDRVDAIMPFRLSPDFAGRVQQRTGPGYLYLMVAPVRARPCATRSRNSRPRASPPPTATRSPPARPSGSRPSRSASWRKAASPRKRRPAPSWCHRPSCAGSSCRPASCRPMLRSAPPRSTWSASAPSP